MDRRRHHRYAAQGRAEVLVLREVDIEFSSATAMAVLTGTPSAAGQEAMVRVTASDGAQVTLRVRTTQCHSVLIAGRRRYRVIYAVLGTEQEVSA